MSETAGDVTAREPFPGIDGIRRTNELLAGYYSRLETLWPEAPVVRLRDDPLFFTDRRFEYGAIPSHLNELLNQKAAKELERLL